MSKESEAARSGFDDVKEEEEFSRALASLGCEYVRLVVTDFHGLFRGKLFPTRSVNAAGEPIVICAITFLCNGQPTFIQDQMDVGFKNCVMRPLASRVLPLPASTRRPHGAKIAQGICELRYNDGSPLQEDPRWIARRQLDRMAAQKLELFAGTEFEFRMFKPGAQGEGLVTAHDDRFMFTVGNMETYESFAIDLDRRLRVMNVDMYTVHSECGKGQVEVPLLPVWGISYADNSCLFKMIARDTALDHGMRVSFMTKDSFEEYSNGAHFNHSVWRRASAEEQRAGEPARANAFYDKQDPEQLSEFGRHWLAGIMHHGPGLTALCCPTVNCYRRLGQPWAPGKIDWDVDNRLSAIRIKLGGEGGTYIENRLPSGPANPYLVLAGTVAAGLDGVARKLEPPKAMSDELGRFPATLSAALDALREDEVLTEALGERFVSWFDTMKRQEVEELKGVEVDKNVPTDLEREKRLYQFAV